MLCVLYIAQHINALHDFVDDNTLENVTGLWAVEMVKKKTLLQNEQLIFKNMLKCETDNLKQNNQTPSKSTDTDAKPTFVY